MSDDIVYIHYGSPKFDINEFCPISNIDRFNKPHGGLWASPVNSDHNWRWWCLNSNYKTYCLNEHFSFKLKDDANICDINSRSDLIKLKQQGFCHDYQNPFPSPQDYYPDFEKLIDAGYDGMAVTMDNNLYFSLYGWDCDSLLVFDPNCMIFV
jgi:hypothetical protein